METLKPNKVFLLGRGKGTDGIHPVSGTQFQTKPPTHPAIHPFKEKELIANLLKVDMLRAHE